MGDRTVETFEQFFAILSEELIKRLRGNLIVFNAEPEGETAKIVIAAVVDQGAMKMRFFEFKALYKGETPRSIREFIKTVMAPAVKAATVKTVETLSINAPDVSLRIARMITNLWLTKRPTDQDFVIRTKGWLVAVRKIGTPEIIAAADEALGLM